jgi:hypothetical protein
VVRGEQELYYSPCQSELDMPSYQSSSKINRADTDVLVVYCSDHRFQAGLHEFLSHGLNLQDNYALLAIPGGPQSLTLVEYLPKFSWVSRKWFRFLAENHHLKRMILIAHQDCGWYKSLPFHLFGSSDPRRRQEEDLRKARQALAKDFPELGVELYYATWDAEDRVSVEAVSA